MSDSSMSVDEMYVQLTPENRQKVDDMINELLKKQAMGENVEVATKGFIS